MAEDTVFHNLDGTPDTGADDTGEDVEIRIEGDDDPTLTGAPDDWVPPSDEELAGATTSTDPALEPDPDEPAPVATDGDADPELQSMPAKFRKRLEREARAKARAYENANALAARLAETEEALRIEREERAKATGATKASAVADIDAKIVDARKALREAIADADVDKQVELNEQLANLMLDRRVAQAQEERAKAQPAASQAPAARQPAAAQPGVKEVAGLGVKSKAAEAWATRNASWLSDPRYANARAAAMKIDQQLYAEGWSIDDPEYFTQLDHRLRKEVVLPAAPRQQRSAVAPDTTSGSGAAGRRVVSLSRDDVALMTKFKLDPKNKAHVREYLATLREERSAQQ